jgi:hypothetical protein
MSDFSAKLCRTVARKSGVPHRRGAGDTHRNRGTIARPHLHLDGLSQFGGPDLGGSGPVAEGQGSVASAPSVRQWVRVTASLSS